MDNNSPQEDEHSEDGMSDNRETAPDRRDEVSDNKDVSADKVSLTSGPQQKLDYAILENISPSKELDNAIEKRKRTQRQIFESLIDENVKLERNLKKRDESFNQLNAKYEVKCIELDAMQVKSRDLEAKVKAMERDIKILAAAAHKNAAKGGKRVSIETSNAENASTHEQNNNNNEADADREKYKIKIHDLQARLTRMSEDDEAKSRKVSEMERELAETRLYVESLEGHVPKDVREELANGVHEPKPKGGLETWGQQTNIVYAGQPQAYRYDQNTEVNKQSTVCVVS